MQSNYGDLSQPAGYNRYLITACWLIVFGATVIAYWPGLSGPFLLDDFGVISALGSYGGVRDWETFSAFVFGGGAGLTGRPLALLTFLVDAVDWPADAWPFKRTNLVIHIINGALLGTLISQILKIRQFETRDARWIALVATACWLLHPFLVSTTLYVVQRMALLAATFIFLGLVGYLYGRVRVELAPRKAYVVMSASIAMCTLLAVLSKENGALLPLLVGVVELTVVAAGIHRLGVLNRGWAVLFIVVPVIVVILYLVRIVLLSDFFAIVPPREFSLYERVLTQPRVLIDYLQNWFIPELYTTGVFQDHFIKSTGILAPWSTLPSILVHGGLIVAAVYKRREWPLFALATLFFYGAHLVESTVVNLELYFEHRNYVSAAFLFVPLIVLLRKAVTFRVFMVSACATLLLLGGFTRLAAGVWQDYRTMVVIAAQKAPTSARAQGQFALDLFNAGRPDLATEVVQEALRNAASGHQDLLLTELTMRCNADSLSPERYAFLSGELAAKTYDPRLLTAYTQLLSLVAENRCPTLAAVDLRSLFQTMLQFRANAIPSSIQFSHLKYLAGVASTYHGDREAAVSSFRESIASTPGASRAMVMAAHLATAGLFDEALEISELALGQLATDQRTTRLGAGISEADIRDFQAVILADRDAQRGGGTDRPEQ